MVILDLNYLEVATESSNVEGGVLNSNTSTVTTTVTQRATAIAGSGGGIRVLSPDVNTAVALNLANITTIAPFVSVF